MNLIKDLYRRRSNIQRILNTRRFLSYQADCQSGIRLSKNPTVNRQNARISELGRHGQVKDAQMVFDEMPLRDVVSYASMVDVYVKNNELYKAERLFKTMPERNVVADSTMIHGYTKVGRMLEARRVFDSMVKRNVYSWTSLISGYFTIGEVDEGRRLFDLMPEKNVVSWNTVVLGYARNGLLDEALDQFHKMPEKNAVTWTAMIKVLVEDGRIDGAIEMFSKAPQRNLYTWNIMLGAYLNYQRLSEALELFDSMPQRNEVSWTTMVTGLAQNKLVSEARKFFDMMPHKDTAAWNAMIKAYADEGQMEEATAIFNAAPERNVVAWNTMIGGFARNSSNGEALELFLALHKSATRADDTTFTTLLPSVRGLLEISQLHGLLLRTGFADNACVSNALITVYSRFGDLGYSKQAFDDLQTKDIISWTSVILAYSNHGHGKDALHIFGRMLKYNVKPDEISFVAVLSACSHAGLVKKGKCIFNSMKQVYGLEPKAEHFSCLVDILGRAGQVNDALTFANKVPPSEQDGAFFGTLLGACKLHNQVELANRVGTKLLELEPCSSGGYVLLSNVYATNGNWDACARVRKKMKEMNVKKVPGISQIEVTGKCHRFCAGSKSHPEFEEIDMFLNGCLLPVMQDYKVHRAGIHNDDCFLVDQDT